MYILIKELGLSVPELVAGCIAFGAIILLEIYLLKKRR
jgi:hypothetical protein